MHVFFQLMLAPIRWLIGLTFLITLLVIDGVLVGPQAGYFDIPNKNVAVIYAAPSFHQEVVSSVTCIMHELGFYTVVYIAKGLQVEGMMLPFSGKRERSSEKFYGRCVSQFVSIRSPMTMVRSPSAIIFVTYPMMKAHKWNTYDQFAFELLRNVRDQKSNSSVVLIVHHSLSYLNYTTPILELVSPNLITFMFLGEHTQREAERITKERVPLEDNHNYHLSHFYPTMPMHYITGQQEVLLKPGNHTQQKDDPVLVIQGHFGGRHTHRKDPASVIECLKQIEDGYVPAGAVAHNTTPRSLNIDLIGQVSGSLKVGKLRNSRVIFRKGLDSPDFYKSIARGRFMVAAIREDTYYTEKATSSVPAALMTEIPVVATRKFLNLYPCLKEGAIHRKINRNEEECTSVYEAVHLSELEYQRAKEEVKYCNNKLWEEAKTVFKEVIVSSKMISIE